MSPSIPHTGIGGNPSSHHGNRTARMENGSSDTQSDDAENRLVSVSGSATASFVYAGDSQRVRGAVGGVTTTYVGNWYEVQGATVKKYYYAGNQRVAMCNAGTLYWLLGDRGPSGWGSTAYTINGTTKTGETRYFPWGKDRFSSGVTFTSYK